MNNEKCPKCGSEQTNIENPNNISGMNGVINFACDSWLWIPNNGEEPQFHQSSICSCKVLNNFVSKIEEQHDKLKKENESLLAICRSFDLQVAQLTSDLAFVNRALQLACETEARIFSGTPITDSVCYKPEDYLIQAQLEEAENDNERKPRFYKMVTCDEASDIATEIYDIGNGANGDNWRECITRIQKLANDIIDIEQENQSGHY